MDEPSTGAATLSLPSLPMARYRLRFNAAEPPSLPVFGGSVWRGAVAHALRRAVCVARQIQCPSCPAYASCAYSAVFETPPPPHQPRLRRYSAAPHPFVIVPRVGEAGSDPHRYEVDLTLIGRANAHLPHLLHAFTTAGVLGMGARRARLELAEVLQEATLGRADWQAIQRHGGALEPLPLSGLEIPPVPSRVSMTLSTPLRLKRNDRHVRAAEFRFSELFGNLLRRTSLLSHFHTDTPLDVDFAALAAYVRSLPEPQAQLHWHDWMRYSPRQKCEVRMGGLLGEIVLEQAHLEAAWPYLWLGQFMHAGKGTSMGLGGYTLEEPPDAAATGHRPVQPAVEVAEH
jgi:hypothetical protein